MYIRLNLKLKSATKLLVILLLDYLEMLFQRPLKTLDNCAQEKVVRHHQVLLAISKILNSTELFLHSWSKEVIILKGMVLVENQSMEINLMMKTLN